MRTGGRVLVGCSLTLTAVGFAAILAATGARAEDEDDAFHLGVIEYELSCMACHGLEGRGDGPDAGQLDVRPADLTQIARRNGGTFPADGLALYIDGRAMVGAHGPREMPVWGDRYRAAVPGEDEGAEAERIARERIEALVLYIETLQEP